MHDTSARLDTMTCSQAYGLLPFFQDTLETRFVRSVFCSAVVMRLHATCRLSSCQDRSSVSILYSKVLGILCSIL